MSLRSEVIAAGMPELMRMGNKREPCHRTYSRHNRANRPWRQGSRLTLASLAAAIKACASEVWKHEALKTTA
jgi:hypothetical protein